MTRKIEVRNFHQAKWDEPVIFELSNKGERGIFFPSIVSVVVTIIVQPPCMGQLYTFSFVPESRKSRGQRI